jgi:hypothetical protein
MIPWVIRITLMIRYVFSCFQFTVWITVCILSSKYTPVLISRYAVNLTLSSVTSTVL